MFWKKKAIIKTKMKPKPLEPKVYPSTRKRAARSKRIEFRITCYLLDEKTDHLLETNSVNLSRSGILVHSLHPMETGQEISCLLANKRGLKVMHVKNNKNTVKAKIVRVEQTEMYYRLALKVTLGRVNPVGFMQIEDDTKYWWSRYWQGKEELET